jgi:hypothetical protein
MKAGRVVWIAYACDAGHRSQGWRRVRSRAGSQRRSPVRKEAIMKTFYVLAVLPMATTSAHAGDSVSFEIDGHKICIEAPTAAGITTPRSR